MRLGLDVFTRVFVIAALAIVASAAVVPAQARTLHYATPSPPTDNPSNEVLRWWADEIRSRTNGSIEIKVHWLGSLVKYVDAAQGVSSGIADIAPMTPEYTQARLPLWSLSATTIGSGDPYVATEAWRRVRQDSDALREETRRFNMKYIAHYSSGGSPVWVSNTRPYVQPEDLGGDKVRLSARTARAAEIGEWPAAQVSLPFTAAYSAMGRGTIDGTQFYLQYMIPYKLYEVAKYVVQPGLGQQTAVVMMNRRVWKSLSEKEQQVFVELRPEFLLRMSRANVKEIDDARAELTDNPEYPVELVKLDDAQREAWKGSLASAQKEFVEKLAEHNPEATRIHQRYMAMLQKVEQEAEENGYPWGRNLERRRR